MGFERYLFNLRQPTVASNTDSERPCSFADNESADTFSFALVLLCLAAGDICLVQRYGKMVSQTTYALGWRPDIPALIRYGCPELARLISEMWELDFRDRPSLKDIVPRIEALSAETTMLDGGVHHTTVEAKERRLSGLEDPLVDSYSYLATISKLRAKHDLLEANTDAKIAQLEAENASLIAAARDRVAEGKRF